MKRHPDWNISIPEFAAGRIYSISEKDALSVSRSQYTPSKVFLANGTSRCVIMLNQLELLHTSDKDRRFGRFQKEGRT